MNREQMKNFLAENCLITGGEMKLSGGGTANYYFDCKRATLRGEFLPPLADWILECAGKITPPPEILGGPTIGADFIAAAAAMRAAEKKIPLTAAAIVRKEPKKHGTKSKIENEPQKPSRIFIVEDVITTGGSIALACDEFIAAGHKIAGIAAIIDRQAGGKESLAEKYKAPVFAMFCKADFGV